MSFQGLQAKYRRLHQKSAAWLRELDDILTKTDASEIALRLSADYINSNLMDWLSEINCKYSKVQISDG